MVREGQVPSEDIKRVLRSFWWVVLLGSLTGTSVAAVLLRTLPKKYMSQTLVLVRQPTVPTEIVKPVVTEDLNQRYASMQEQILSRTRLQPIIEKFGLYPQLRSRVPMDRLITELRQSIQVTPVEPMQGTNDKSLPGFHVAVTLASPQLAQQVCTEITLMFLDQNAKSRERQAVQTTSFLTQQLDEAKGKLDEQDANLAKFKSRYLGSLPDQEQANLSLLNGMNSQLEANTQALTRAQQDKAFNQTLLDQEVANWSSTKTGKDPATVDQDLVALQRQLAELEAKYTNEHPDVIKLKNQIQDLKSRMAASDAKPQDQDGDETKTTAVHSPQIQQLRAKVRQDEVTISSLVAQQQKIQEQIGVLQARIQSSPAVEQQFKELTRNYQTALDFYNDLLKKRENSAMATNLEHEQESEQFSILDPPSLPLEPSFPQKKVFLGAGFAGGAALGVGILALIVFSDKSMHTERDVELSLKLPVLTVVPIVGSPVSRNNDGSRATAAREGLTRLAG